MRVFGNDILDSKYFDIGNVNCHVMVQSSTLPNGKEEIFYTYHCKEKNRLFDICGVMEMDGNKIAKEEIDRCYKTMLEKIEEKNREVKDDL